MIEIATEDDGSITKLLNKACNVMEITNAKYDIKIGSEKGDGYLSIINVVKVTGDDNKSLNLLVKTAAKSEEFRKQVPLVAMFSNETQCYDTIFPAFFKFQLDKSLNNPFTNVPKCYATSMEEFNEGLVLDNLREVGYSICDRRKPMDDDHISFVLTQYGKFHAISYALKDQNYEKYQTVTSKLLDVYSKYVDDSNSMKTFVSICTKAKYLLDPINDAVALERFEYFLENLSNFQQQSCSRNMHDHSVVVHGDCWTNNMMFQYKDHHNPKKPTNICFIDWQLARSCSPILDIAHFFYVCSSEETLNNYHHFKDIYYNSLASHMTSLGSNPNEIFSRTDFEGHWKKYSPHGLIMALFMLPVVMSAQDEVPDVVNAADTGGSVIESFNCEPKDKEYQKRVRNVILHFVNNNLI